MYLKDRARRLKTNLPALALALRHKRTPWAAKALAALTVAYALSPVDLIPDFIPVLGYLDDLLLLPALIALTVRLIPAAVLEECRVKAAEAQGGSKGKNRWYCALPVLIIWGAALFLVLRAVFFRRK